jgi:dTDP-4-amino-4,6-dideoxy-D-galactose acyltransferase
VNRLIEPLRWDTEFFSVNVGRITASCLDDRAVQSVLEEAQRNGFRCLYFEANPNDLTTVVAAEQNGFHLADVRVVLEYPFSSKPAPINPYLPPADLLITPATDSDLPLLEEISMEIGRYSRFAFDNNFREGEDKRLYRLWIHNSLNGFADVVYVARRAGERSVAVGLVACVMRDSIAHIQLAGVHHGHRNAGVGTGLMQASLDWAKSRKASSMRVVTQARNASAQRLYQQMGFFTKSMTLFYHKWL